MKLLVFLVYTVLQRWDCFRYYLVKNFRRGGCSLYTCSSILLAFDNNSITSITHYSKLLINLKKKTLIKKSTTLLLSYVNNSDSQSFSCSLHQLRFSECHSPPSVWNYPTTKSKSKSQPSTAGSHLQYG